MKKILAIIALAAVAVMSLSGCVKSRSVDSESTVESVDMGPIYYNGSTEGETFLSGLDGNKVKVSEIKYLLDKKYKPTNILDEKNFSHAECVGFSYAFKPSVYFDSENNPEMFGGDTYIGNKAEPNSEYFRVNVGDKFGGLTVKSARCFFTAYKNNGEDYLGYSGSEIEFDGEITLKGRLEIPSQMDAYPGLILDMNFYCEFGSGLPLSLSYFYEPELGFYHMPIDRHTAYTDMPDLNLGKFTDYSLDFDGLAEGDGAEAEITVGNLRLVQKLEGSGFAYAQLIGVKRL